MKQIVHIEDKESNQFYRDNPQMFDQLIDIINTTTFFCRELNSKHKDIVSWVNQKTPLLNDSQFNLLTKIYWILHGLTTFPSCKVCETKIVRNVYKLTDPKYKYCSLECAHKSPEMPILGKKTKFQKYGDETYNNRAKFHETMNSIPNDIKQGWQQKKIETCLVTYGVEHVSQIPEVQAKSLNTRHQKYNGRYESEESSAKRKQSFIDHYGVDNNMKSEEGMQAYIDSIRHKYGDNTIVSVFQVKEVKQKGISSFKEHMKDDTFREQRRQKLIDASNKQFGPDNYMNRTQAKETCLDNYGVENPFQIPEIRQKGSLPETRRKAEETKRLNGTFNTSKPEEHAYELLCEHFNENNIIRQYKSEEYPFNCDFYIKAINAYVECNFTWTHNDHFFDETNEDDMKVVQLWQSKNTDYYRNAIETWTIRDVNKRKIAELNHLNYLVFWNFEQFLDWISSLEK